MCLQVKQTQTFYSPLNDYKSYATTKVRTNKSFTKKWRLCHRKLKIKTIRTWQRSLFPKISHLYTFTTMFPENMSSSMYNTRYLGLATFAINSAVHCLSLSAHKNICFYFCSTSVWIRSNTAALQADPWSSQQFIHKIMV